MRSACGSDQLELASRRRRGPGPSASRSVATMRWSSRVVQPDLEVEDVVAGREPRRDLRAQLVVLAAREVEEVRHVAAHRAAEQAPERLADGLAADVRERHVDAGPGEVARAGAELPEAEVERVGAHRVAVPGVAPDRERRHGLHRGLDEAASEPLVASPQPTRPSSVVTRTRMSVTPSRATIELTSRWL